MDHSYNWKGAIIMGLIKAGIGALGGTLTDQWKEFFYCESMPKEVLVTKGQKPTRKEMTTSSPMVPGLP